MARNRQPKTRRKTVRPKLNITGIDTNHDPLPENLNLDWQAIQDQYVPIPEEAKRRCEEAIKRYIWRDDAESRGLSLGDAEEAMCRLTKSLRASDDLIAAMAKPAEKYALSVVDRNLGKDGDLQRILAGLIAACERASNQLRNDSGNAGFVEGAAWEQLVRDLLHVAQEFDLPRKISKPSPKQKSDYTLSPFLRFLRAIEAQIQKPKWPWPSTDSSLATAANDVRAASRKRKTGA